MNTSKVQKYRDVYGDWWIRLDDYYVQRLRDGNIGTWQDGNGLEAV